MPNVRMIEQFGEQNVFRTVSVGFQPYLPFTQAYAMRLKSTIPTVAGASSAGYFDLAPEDDESLGENERDGYPYVLRRQIYQGQGEGRTRIMSAMMPREDVALASARGISGQASSDVMGQELQQLLDSQSATPDSIALNSRVRDEIEIGMLSNLYSALEGTDDQSGQAFDRSGDFGRSQDFDVFLEEHDSFRRFLQTHLPENLNIQSAEVARDAGGSASHKILAQVDTSQTNLRQATNTWTTHIQRNVNEWNARITQEWTQAGYNATATGRDFETAKEMFPTATRGQSIYDLRQFLNRVGRSQSMMDSAGRAMEPIRHVYQVTLTPSTVGFATFYPRWEGGVPQIGFDENNVVVVSAIDGNVINAFTDWMIAQNTVNLTLINEIMFLAHEEANAVAVSTRDRVERTGDYSTAALSLDFFNNVQLNIAGTGGQIHLTTTEIAQNLREQINNYYNNAGTTQAFANWYQALLQQSNDLTKDWWRAVGPGPVGNSQGTTISSEWVFGDDKGNPRKHLLGVWSDVMEDTWRGTGMTETGYNFSISPLVTSRRAGVASFR
jgi:hypothetical protein